MPKDSKTTKHLKVPRQKLKSEFCTFYSLFRMRFKSFLKSYLFTGNFGPFCKNFAHFSGNFLELKKVKKVKKWFKNGPKWPKKAKKGVRKVQNYHKKVKKGSYFAFRSRRKMPKNE